MPEDGYPTEEELKQIREWSYTDLLGWFAFIKSCWWSPEWGWRETEEDTETVFHISTGGWSGNEEIIGSMRKNVVAWTQTWAVHRRGGHFEFMVRRANVQEGRSNPTDPDGG